ANGEHPRNLVKYTLHNGPSLPCYSLTNYGLA
ncbi:MAG: hypothetical protein ACI86X_000962, partial [Moritella sp.]